MKAEELRIGNLVKCFGDVMTIDSITEKEASCHSSNGTRYRDISIGVYRGIPLTEEWLVKFGFEKSPDAFGGYISPICGYNHMRLRWTFQEHFEPLRQSYWAHFIGNGERAMGRYIRTDYIHQLQNLFYELTGSELKVKG